MEQRNDKSAGAAGENLRGTAHPYKIGPDTTGADAFLLTKQEREGRELKLRRFFNIP